MSIALNGFITGLSLIIAIGPQNALLLRQGLKRVAVTHVIAVCLISDVFLIVGGTLGVGVIVEKAPIVLVALKWLGFFYLLYFAYTCFRDALKSHSLTVDESAPSAPEKGEALVSHPRTPTWRRWRGGRPADHGTSEDSAGLGKASHCRASVYLAEPGRVCGYIGNARWHRQPVW